MEKLPIRRIVMLKHFSFIVLASLQVAALYSAPIADEELLDANSKGKPFVTAHIMGQLGNNLFQIATASALAWDNNADTWFAVFGPVSVIEHVFFRCKILPA